MQPARLPFPPTGSSQDGNQTFETNKTLSLADPVNKNLKGSPQKGVGRTLRPYLLPRALRKEKKFVTVGCFLGHRKVGEYPQVTRDSFVHTEFRDRE